MCGWPGEAPPEVPFNGSGSLCYRCPTSACLQVVCLAPPRPPCFLVIGGQQQAGKEGGLCSACCLRRARDSLPDLPLHGCHAQYEGCRGEEVVARPGLQSGSCSPLTSMKLATAADRAQGYGALQGFRCNRCGSQRHKVTGALPARSGGARCVVLAMFCSWLAEQSHGQQWCEELTKGDPGLFTESLTAATLS